jgi:DNA-binding transcriptional MocR family regulator
VSGAEASYGAAGTRFHNPTGALMDWETRKEVARLARHAGVTVVTSEIMRDLDLREPPAPVRRVPGAIVIGSMSKSVWGGMRWAGSVAPPA